MIALNRPYDGGNGRMVNGEWLMVNGERDIRLTYSSREGLNVIYRKLYEERGAMRVAVSPLTCFIAIYPMVANGHVPDEVHYSLGYGHKTADVEGFFASIQRWLDTPDRKAICAERRAKMLSEKVDYAKFLTWFIEHYPSSASEVKNATPDFWERFK